MSMILLQCAYKIFTVKIKRRIILVTPEMVAAVEECDQFHG